MFIALQVLALLTFPVIGLIFSIYLYLKADTPRQKIIFSVLVSMLFGFFAYNMTPENTFDIVSHHNKVEIFEGVDSISSYIDMTKKLDIEPVPCALSFLVSRFNDPNILQFIVVVIGYSLLLYMLSDYKNSIKLNNRRFIPILLLILFGQSTLYYFSGLYNYLAINIFAFAFYVDYYKKKKILPYLLYILTIFVHSGMIMPLSILVVYKIFRKIAKKTSPFIIVPFVAIGMFFSTEILSFFINNFGMSFFAPIRDTLGNYIVKNLIFQRFYHGFGLMVDISKILISAYIVIKSIKIDEKNREPAGFVIVFLSAISLLLFRTVLMARFAALVLFMSFVPLMDFAKNYNKKKKSDKILFAVICILAIIYTSYCIKVVLPYETDAFKNVFINTFVLLR